jgi:hypothetical protein
MGLSIMILRESMPSKKVYGVVDYDVERNRCRQRASMGLSILILKESIPSKRINGVVDFDFERINAARTSTEGHQSGI